MSSKQLENEKNREIVHELCDYVNVIVYTEPESALFTVLALRAVLSQSRSDYKFTTFIWLFPVCWLLL